jgi:mono/diheme cytochrome c family protein
MPGFAWRLSNDEVAQLLTFVRTSWGNQASSVSASEVARVRGSLDAAAAAKTTSNN